MYYIPDYVNEGEESLLLTEIAERTPKPKWRTLNNRRCINYGGIVGRSALIRCLDTPEWLVHLMARVDQTLTTRTLPGRLNHCLINEYTPGQGIMVSRLTHVPARMIRRSHITTVLPIIRWWQR
jgi:alkylated DNA repair protein alkB family protein 6